MKKESVTRRIVNGFMVSVLACWAGSALAQCPDAPESGELIYGWNDAAQDSWGGNPGPTMNTDKQLVREGAGSASVDFTDQPTWASAAFVLDLPEPQDWTKYGIVSVD